MTDLGNLTAALAGRYRIERELGAGGMATVYLAHDLKHDRNVAIKVLRPNVATMLGADRFIQEIHLAARLNHPNILPLHDSGEAAAGEGRDPFLYYVMPAMEGSTLRERLRTEGKLPVATSARIARQVADALDHAHRHGVVHRDIKPENILLHEGHALVADFGIGKALAAADGGANATQTGFIVGTPAYMSPEQAAGDPVDGRSDLYSLGCVLSEMLTGEPPLAFRFATWSEETPASRPTLPNAMKTVLRQLLVTRPAGRVASGAQVVELLRNAESAATTDPATERSVAVLPFVNMSADPDDEFFSDGITEEIINALTQLRGLRVAARTSAFSFKGRTEDLRTVGEKLNVGTIVEGSIRRAGNRLRITAQLVSVADGYQLWSERFDREMTDVFAIQDEIATAITSKLEVSLAGEAPGQLIRPGTDDLEAYRLFLKGRALVAQRGPALALAVTTLEAAIRLDPDYARALAALANALTLLCISCALRPEAALPRAREAASRAVARDPSLAEARMASAMLAAAEGDYRAAEQEWERAGQLGPADVELQAARALWGLGYLRGDFEVAAEAGRRAVAMDPLNAYARSNLALLYAHAGRPAEGVAQARRAVELDPRGYLSNLTLVRLLFYDGKYPEAFARGERTAAASDRHVWIVGELAMGHGRAGQIDRAAALYRELVERSKVEYVEHIWLAGAAEWAGLSEEAIRHLRLSGEERQPLVAMAGRYGFPLFVPQWQARPEYHQVLRQVAWKAET